LEEEDDDDKHDDVSIGKKSLLGMQIGARASNTRYM
jgi:hypothetical protein